MWQGLLRPLRYKFALIGKDAENRVELDKGLGHGLVGVTDAGKA